MYIARKSSHRERKLGGYYLPSVPLENEVNTVKRKDRQLNPETHILTKDVLVEDPWCWYDEDIIEARMYILGDGKTVRVSFFSIDDFGTYRDFGEWSADSNWKWMKRWCWDRIPDIVSCEWMYERGFLDL